MLLGFEVQNYRSLRSVQFDFGQINVIVGANGSGKTNVYRALELVAAAADERFLRQIASEGGLESIKWAGKPLPKRSKREPWRLKLGVAFDDLCYRMELGFPAPDEGGPFGDPEIKEEVLWPRAGTERSFLMRRKSASLHTRDAEGRVVDREMALESWELGLGSIRDVVNYPELSVMRERLCGARFYHGFRSDPDSPIRRDEVAYMSPVLDADGLNLGATLATADYLKGLKPIEPLYAAVRDALDAGLVPGPALRVAGLFRDVGLHEMSDGQLRFLCLAAALSSPRPPPLLVFNEPESSLHDDVLPVLARLFVEAAESSQIILTTHSPLLADEIDRLRGVERFELRKIDGATVLA